VTLHPDVEWWRGESFTGLGTCRDVHGDLEQASVQAETHHQAFALGDLLFGGECREGPNCVLWQGFRVTHGVDSPPYPPPLRTP
jgi:hypothetical protein